MDSYAIISTYSLEDLQQRASNIVAKGYIPAGGITQVPHRYKFYTDERNSVSNSDTTTPIQFIQSFYKPPTNPI